MPRLPDTVIVPLAAAFMLVVVLVAGPPFLAFFVARGVVLRVWFYAAHRRHGRFVLFVYSESPNWQQYIEQHILPRLGGRAVVLNWSQRRQWARICPWESRVFRHFTGPREFNPIALVFVGPWRVISVRFYRAFLDLKHGRESGLRQAEAELLSHLPPLGAVAA